jgi:hypothetical protein
LGGFFYISIITLPILKLKVIFKLHTVIKRKTKEEIIMKEIWKQTKYEGYEASNLGRIRSGKKIFIGSLTKKGYRRTVLTINGKEKSIFVHQIIAETFIDNPNNYKYINHKDENESNNEVSNLEWCDINYNDNYGKRNENISKAMKNNEKICKKVRCIEKNIIYNSIKDAEKELMVYNIVKVVTGQRKTAGGYHFEYV